MTVIYDACVLYPNDLRDILLEVGVQGIFQARWTDAIHDEWTRHLTENRPVIDPATIDRVRRLMNRAIPNCLVTGYKHLIAGLTLPDANDRHVLAAAIKAGAGAIVTFNLKDFPLGSLQPHGVEARHPDKFLKSQLDSYPGEICGAVRRLRARLKRPAMAAVEYLENLSRQGLPRFVEKLREFAGEI